MELSIKSKFMSEEILEKRRQMIENENLHIKEKITMEAFKELYSKYGAGMNEKDFAWAFLDIDELRYYNIEKGRVQEPLILAYEYVSDEEFETIRAAVVKAYGLNHGDKIPYEQILEMYNKFGGKLSINLFLEEILGIRSSILKNFKKGDVKRGKVNFDAEPGKYNEFNGKRADVPMYVLSPEYIHELRKRLLEEAGLRVGDSLLYAQIQELNQQFCSEMPEILFSEKVLDISANTYNGLKNGKSTKAINGAVFQDIVISDEYVKWLQNKIAGVHQLESGQLIKKDEYQELYDKYGGILSRRSFGILIMDMTIRNYGALMESQVVKSVPILSSRKKTDFDVLRERVIRENKLHHGDMMNYEQFQEIHQKYAPNISEFVFAEKVFKISNPSFQHIKYNQGRARISLRLPTVDEIKALQKRVILENNIHINDNINYVQLKELHSKYGGIMPIRMFAIEVLRLDKQSFLRIKNHPDKDAFVLFNLEISESEIENIKQNVIFDNDLQTPRQLTLKEIETLYETYGGIMSKQMFLRRILGVSQSSFDNLRYKKNDATIVCVRGDFTEDEVKQLKQYLAEGLSHFQIALKLGVTVTVLRLNMNKLIEAKELTETDTLYERVKMLSDDGKTPEEIEKELDISTEEVQEMLFRAKKESDEEDQKKKAEDKEKKRKSDIKKRAIRALDKYEYTTASIKKVRAYIAECQKSFEEGTFSRKEMYFLMECMIFVQCACKEIELFSRMCIHFNEYNMASDFIAENNDNEGITPKEREKLMKLRDSVNYAIKKEQALEFLKQGNQSPSQIAENTGILEVEVIGLKRKLDEQRVALIGGKKSEDGIGTL